MRRSVAALVAVAAVVMAGCASGAASDGPRAAQTTLPTVTPLPSPSPSPSETEPERPSLSFAVIGDWGAGTRGQKAVARRMCKWRRSHPFDIVVTTGDNIYEKGDPRGFREKFFEPMRCLLNRGVQFHATLGNHDVLADNGRPQIRHPAFGMKGRNYVLRRAGVRFVMADSNSLNRRWLRRAVRSRKGDRRTVVVFHHPVYSSGIHGSTPGYSDSLPRMFRNAGVDLVLTGHDHNYEVTKELRGIRYVVTGGGGAYLRGCGKSWFTDGRCESRHHFLYVVANANRIVVRAIAIAGPPFDRFATTGRP